MFLLAAANWDLIFEIEEDIVDFSDSGCAMLSQFEVAGITVRLWSESSELSVMIGTALK